VVERKTKLKIVVRNFTEMRLEIFNPLSTAFAMLMNEEIEL
jgi:hypothetical protein